MPEPDQLGVAEERRSAQRVQKARHNGVRLELLPVSGDDLHGGILFELPACQFSGDRAGAFLDGEIIVAADDDKPPHESPTFPLRSDGRRSLQ